MPLNRPFDIFGPSPEKGNEIFKIIGFIDI
jgi:hypothetical protein